MTPRQKGAKNEYAQALESLTRALAHRDHSRFELQQKLLRKFDASLVERVIGEAEANGWLASEELVAERLVLALEHRKKSRQYIEDQLKKRRLPIPSLSVENELEIIRELVERKFGSGPLSEDGKAKAYRFLQYRGFDDRMIKQVVK